MTQIVGEQPGQGRATRHRPADPVDMVRIEPAPQLRDKWMQFLRRRK
jgi:hypothetical protein